MTEKELRRSMARLARNVVRLARETEDEADGASAFIGLGMAAAKYYLDGVFEPNKEDFLDIVGTCYESCIREILRERNTAGLLS